MLEIKGQSCPKCGISGIHACPGKPLPKPTPEEEARIRKVFENLASDHKVIDNNHERLA